MQAESAAIESCTLLPTRRSLFETSLAMSSTLRTTRVLLPLRSLASSPKTTFRASYATVTKDWEGRQPSEHVTNRKDDLNIQASASKSGQGDRQKGSPKESEGGHSQATTEVDKGGQNEQAKKDHPEAPGPVIGMNDERGGVSTKQPA